MVGRRGFFKVEGGSREGTLIPDLPQLPPSGVCPVMVEIPRAEPREDDAGLSLDLLLLYRKERVEVTGEDEEGEGLRLGEA